MNHHKTHEALAAINKATNQPWEYTEVYDALTLHTPTGYYLLTCYSWDCPNIDWKNELILGWYPDNQKSDKARIIDSVKNLETLTAWATGYSA